VDRNRGLVDQRLQQVRVGLGKRLPVDAVGVLPDVFLPLPAGAAEREREIDRVRTLLEQPR
jgi:hypothetical protein